MPSPPREIGTLIVVVLKANHLQDKRPREKQNPYCVVTVNGSGKEQRTKAIKRGGQHPEWDEEIRFTLFEHVKLMKLVCFADNSGEPDFIGEADVDFTQALTTGETDEWFALTNKDKFAGRIYLELTFRSNVPPHP